MLHVIVYFKFKCNCKDHGCVDDLKLKWSSKFISEHIIKVKATIFEILTILLIFFLYQRLFRCLSPYWPQTVYSILPFYFKREGSVIFWNYIEDLRIHYGY